MGVTVTFIAILELMKEGLIEIVQAEAYAADPRAHGGRRAHLTVVEGGLLRRGCRERSGARAAGASRRERHAETMRSRRLRRATTDSVTAAANAGDTPDPETTT